MQIKRKPEWLKISYDEQATQEVRNLMSNLHLNTVCSAANCPNLGECFKRSTATFMILGQQCSRNCRFCNVTHGKPEAVDFAEPEHIAEAVETLGLKYVVITSVTRDDLPDGGSKHFADCVKAIRARSPQTSIELLIPDMRGDEKCLDIILASKPDVLNHNMETVESLYETVRPEANYQQSLHVLAYCKSSSPNLYTKTGIMVGLGETPEQVYQLMDDILAQTQCDILTIGQYLRPTSAHLEVKEYITPAQFDEYKKIAEQKGFSYVASGPLVRSSYKADEIFSKESNILP